MDTERGWTQKRGKLNMSSKIVNRKKLHENVTHASRDLFWRQRGKA